MLQRIYLADETRLRDVTGFSFLHKTNDEVYIFYSTKGCYRCFVRRCLKNISECRLPDSHFLPYPPLKPAIFAHAISFLCSHW